jgi:hypothetical protein
LRSSMLFALRLLLGLACFVPVWGQGTQLAVTPSVANLVIGGSQRFRLVDQNGRQQHHVSWIVFEPEAFEVQQGDDLVLTAKKPGSFRIGAESASGSAQASVKVIEGAALPAGSIIWSASTPEGCKTTKIVPAVPSASGVDIFETSRCQDGDYVSAYTAEGILVWRRKISAAPGSLSQPVDTGQGAPNSSSVPSSSASSRGTITLASVCDVIAIGATREDVQDLLKSRSRQFSSEGDAGQVWIVEETNMRCQLWFDDKSVVAKKRKTLVTE